MKARQLVDDIKVKQLQAVKNDVIKKDAAKKIQKAIRRKNAQNDIRVTPDRAVARQVFGFGQRSRMTSEGDTNAR